MNSLKYKKIIVGITGSIAAYKSAILVRLLVKEGVEVKVIMTNDACKFISPLTLSTLSKNKVTTNLIDDDSSWNNHVELGLWADVMIVAPTSANTIANFANGICNNLLTAVYLSARCPVCIAPAMDEDMWKHPSTQKNIDSLISYGNKIIPINSGELASGLNGEGRMAEPEAIVSFLASLFAEKKSPGRLAGKKAIVTAGPTYEAIDPVRFIGNHSSGKMGIAIADALAHEGATVELVLGPSDQKANHTDVKTIHVTTAAQMLKATVKSFKKADIAVMAAAVADYTPEEVSKQKIKKHNGDALDLKLIKTQDILRTLGKEKKKTQLLVGFALETNDELKNAKEKLKKKNLDFIVLNSLNDNGAGFKHDTNQITIIDKNKKSFSFPLKTKQEVAKDIVEHIVRRAIGDSKNQN